MLPLSLNPFKQGGGREGSGCVPVPARPGPPGPPAAPACRRRSPAALRQQSCRPPAAAAGRRSRPCCAPRRRPEWAPQDRIRRVGGCGGPCPTSVVVVVGWAACLPTRPDPPTHLRHGPLARHVSHALPELLIGVHQNLHVGISALPERLLGTLAVRAGWGGHDGNVRRPEVDGRRGRCSGRPGRCGRGRRRCHAATCSPGEVGRARCRAP